MTSLASSARPLKRVGVALSALTLLVTPLLVSPPSAQATASPAARACSPFGHVAPSVNWPVATWAVCTAGAIAQSSPTAATVGGRTLVAVGDESGYVHLLDASTGRELPGWPVRLQTTTGGVAAIESSPTFAWLDGPGKPPTVIVGSGSTWVSGSVGEVEAIRLNGSVRFVFHVGAVTGTATGVISTPAVGNLTGDGQQDIVFGSWDHYIYALTPDGHLVPGFPVNNRDTVWSSAALYHRPGSKGDDLYIGSDSSGWQGCVGGWISDYRYIASAPHLVWQHCTPQAIWSSPTVGVLTNAKRPAVVVGTGWFVRDSSDLPAGADELYAFNALTGAPEPGWPVRLPGPTVGSPAIGQLSPGGPPSVVESGWSCASTARSSCFRSGSYVAAVSATGSPMWTVNVPGPTALGSPVLVPLEGESTNDVLIGTPNALYPLDGRDGAYLYGTNGTNQFAAIDPGCRMFNTPAVAQVGGSAWTVFQACGGPAEFSARGEVVAYTLPVQPDVTPAWPMFHGGPAHLGVERSTVGAVPVAD